MLGPKHLGSLAEHTRSTGVDNKVAHRPDGRVRHDSLGGVGCSALDSNDEVGVIDIVTLKAGYGRKHVSADSPAFFHCLAGASYLLQYDAFHRLAREGDRLLYVVNRTFAAEAHQQYCA
jgi:hypothetical protein